MISCGCTPYGASLMLGWTLLLLWDTGDRSSRRFIAPLTVLVILALILTDVVAVRAGALAAWRMLPTWCLQAVLIVLFVAAYRHRSVRVPR